MKEPKENDWTIKIPEKFEENPNPMTDLRDHSCFIIGSDGKRIDPLSEEGMAMLDIFNSVYKKRDDNKA